MANTIPCFHEYISPPLALPPPEIHECRDAILINAPVYKCVREDSAVVRVSRPGHAHILSEGVVPKNCRESLGPTGRIDDRIIVDLVEVVAAILVSLLYKLAHYLRGRLLQARKRGSSAN